MDSIVKPLEWDGPGHWSNGPDEWWLEEANTTFGWGYCVEFGRSGNFIVDSTFDWSQDGFNDPDAAKAAAQADYEARILSALTTDPQALVAAAYEAAAEAVDAIDDRNSGPIADALLKARMAVLVLTPADARAALDRVIAEAKAEEREARAEIAAGYAGSWEDSEGDAGLVIAAAIRARGESE